MIRKLMLSVLMILAVSPRGLADTLVVDVIAATDLQVPGADPGVTYALDSGTGTFSAAMNHAGMVSFVTDLRGPGVVLLENGQAILARDPGGSMEIIGRRGRQATGTPEGAQLYLFKVGGIAGDGTVGFRAELDWNGGGGGVTNLSDMVMYKWKTGEGTTLLAREGQTAPGSELLLWPFSGWFLPPALVPQVGESGRMLFKYPLEQGTEALEALFATDDQGDLAPVAWVGMEVPGLEGGELFQGLGKAAAMNDQGRMVFRGSLKSGPGGAQVLAARDTVLMGPGADGGLTVLAREGDPVPGVPGSSFYNIENLDLFSISNDGRVAFTNLYTLGGVNYQGLFETDLQGQVHLLLSQGDPAPGFELESGVFKSFSHVARATNGTLAWMSDVTIGEDYQRGLFWRSPEGETRLIMREGAPVPGLDGAIFGWPGMNLHLNASGQFLFTTTVYIIEPFSSFETLWLYTPGTGLQRVLAGGDRITVAPGDERTVKVMMPPSHHPATGSDADSRIIALSNSGEILVALSFVESTDDPAHYLSGGLVKLKLIPGDSCDSVDCDDGDPCTSDSCLDGVCSHVPESCDDQDGCTQDVCDPQEGCVHSALDCDDQDPCTQDLCQNAGECRHDPIPGCCPDDDYCRQPWISQGLPCTMDRCDPDSHTCVVEQVEDCCTADIECDDGDACTSNACVEGTCQAWAFTCNDNNACTQDSCSPMSGCLYEPVSCDDGNPCTTDGCYPGQGCWHDELFNCCNTSQDCDDANDCTLDQCSGNLCSWSLAPGCCYSPADCDDQDPCTTDTCNLVEGKCLNYRPFQEERCEGDDLVQVDTCGEVLLVLETCEFGCAEAACCLQGFHVEDDLCVTDSFPDQEPDVLVQEDTVFEDLIPDPDQGGLDTIEEVIPEDGVASADLLEEVEIARDTTLHQEDSSPAEDTWPGEDTVPEEDSFIPRADSLSLPDTGAEPGPDVRDPGGSGSTGGCTTADSRTPSPLPFLILSVMLVLALMPGRRLRRS